MQPAASRQSDSSWSHAVPGRTGPVDPVRRVKLQRRVRRGDKLLQYL